jgi:hypothetical protein
MAQEQAQDKQAWYQARYAYQQAKAELVHDLLQFAEVVKASLPEGDADERTVEACKANTALLKKIHREMGLGMNVFFELIHDGRDRAWLYGARAMAERED